ncbi:histone-lysine N-methyltransferase SMYD3 [Osmerus eperlanus]|uniref:histone-lysine N-methyltransferase SMYD3 n=1 Tax=Osmerus eperlanus TaxID=29151 RepID=UPI002E145E97
MNPKIERFVSPGKGNGIRATQKILAGELICSAQPLASCVSNKSARKICHNCFSRCESLLRCSQCRSARYCHTACQRQAWPEHKRECRSLRSLLPRMPSDSVRLAARIIFRLLDPSPGSSEELYSLEEHETHLGVMSEEKREGLTQLGSMLQLYLQQEVPALSQEVTSPLPSGLDPLSLLARVSSVLQFAAVVQ